MGEAHPRSGRDRFPGISSLTSTVWLGPCTMTTHAENSMDGFAVNRWKEASGNHCAPTIAWTDSNMNSPTRTGRFCTGVQICNGRHTLGGWMSIGCPRTSMCEIATKTAVESRKEYNLESMSPTSSRIPSVGFRSLVFVFLSRQMALVGIACPVCRRWPGPELQG